MFSLADQLALSRNRPAGFDYMRIALAAAIVCLHSLNVTVGFTRTLEILSSARIGVAMILALFFALSGFLVTGSLLRCRSLISFLGLRLLRIGPALAVETTLSAIVIGPLFTELPLAQYFADPKFAHYFRNIVGDIHYQLPGVFLHNPMADVVNAQLWTVPYELWCYIILAALAAATICFSRALYLAFLGCAQVGLVAYALLYPSEPSIQLAPHLLVFCFLAGVGFHLWRDKTPFNRTTFLFALVVCAACLTMRSIEVLAPVPAAYVACYLGALNPRRSWIVSSGDYSYGIFLYGFAIQQCVAAFGTPVRHWYLNILISLPICFCVAFASWHLVEKHALRLKSRINRFESAVLARISIIGFWRRSHDAIELGVTLGNNRVSV
ncbi:acyltransferase [Bradyrhizobium genosp. L]|uniref:acyltransferase family protein n=1 Tax=Bradyrhizobium genosp. L TaxID=83637 RepID=UPI0018A29ADB|nr:acyltransferase [Bradyrhizobium genosp. L]QPF85922.1 acyltransferase [Bradyrhizobium genosp. L]